MANPKDGLHQVPGYPFGVPPPFPGSHLRTLMPSKMPSHGKYEMVEVSSLPKTYQGRSPVVCLGCVWDPITHTWVMSDWDRMMNKQMINQYNLFKDESLLGEYMRKMTNRATEEDSLNESVWLMNLVEKLQDSIGPCLPSVFSIEQDLAENILANLDSSSLLNMELACMAFKEFVNDKNIWQKRLNQLLQSNQSNPDVLFEWGLKLKLHSAETPQPKLTLKKTLTQFDRIGQNFREGSAILSECSQVKFNTGLSMICNERFLAERQDINHLRNRICVMDVSRRMNSQGDKVDIHEVHSNVIGMTKDTLVTFPSSGQINLFSITLDHQNILERVSYVTSIRPTKKILHLSVVGDFLAILMRPGPVIAEYVEIYRISSSQPVLICEVQIPGFQAILSLASFPTYFMYWWSSIDISNDKIFFGLRKNMGRPEENEIYVVNFQGEHLQSIGEMLDESREQLENMCLKACDGYLYVVTFEKIKIWSEEKSKIIMTRRIDLVNDKFPVTIGLNAKVLIVANEKMMMAWDRKECETDNDETKDYETSETKDYKTSECGRKEFETRKHDRRENQKNNGNECKFSRQVMAGCDASLLWTIELPMALEKISLGTSKITLIPWYQGDNVMVLDFWK